MTPEELDDAIDAYAEQAEDWAAAASPEQVWAWASRPVSMPDGYRDPVDPFVAGWIRQCRVFPSYALAARMRRYAP